MDWTSFDMDRLFELYEQNFYQLRLDVIQVNRELGSVHPEKTWMELLDREQFEKLIKARTDEPEVIERWVRVMIRGHEDEFPELRVA